MPTVKMMMMMTMMVMIMMTISSYWIRLLYVMKNQVYKKFITHLKRKEKTIRQGTRLREYEDLPLTGSNLKAKPSYLKLRALITREIMRSKEAQCTTNILKTCLPVCNVSVFKILACVSAVSGYEGGIL